MPRLSITNQTLKILFAHSGNQCAFPDCSSKLFDEDDNFIGQICHIEAAERGGERFNPIQSDEDRRSYENLLVLCYEHHIKTNDVERYPVEKMKSIKENHEKRFKQTQNVVTEIQINKIINYPELLILWFNLGKEVFILDSV